MKTYLLLLLFVSCSAYTFSQNTDIYKRKPWESIEKNFFWQKPQSKIITGQVPAPPDDNQNMPVMKIEIHGNKIGATHKGEIVYAMTPDNMPCVVPDSTFQSNMPVKGFRKVVPDLHK